MALLTENIPHHHRIALRLPVDDTDIFQPFEQFFRRGALLRNASQVAFHVGHKHRDANFRERLRQLLQGDGFSRPRRTGNQPVAVRHTGQQEQLFLQRSGNQQWCTHGARPLFVLRRV
ncbi:hypothetical protein D3C78_1519540 [compost metagenome]